MCADPDVLLADGTDRGVAILCGRCVVWRESCISLSSYQTDVSDGRAGGWVALADRNVIGGLDQR